jgi:hypothetical protein
MNDPTYLLMICVRETAAAQTIINQLVALSAEMEVLVPTAVKPMIDELDRHMRAASCAATALANAANGLRPPRQGD